jgi:glycosyltransferase involved in cell wall biosynthesis
VAGAEAAPKAFYRTFGRKAALKQQLRDISNAVVRIDPFVRRTARKAATVLAATPETAASLEHALGRDAQTCLAIGWSGEVAPPRRDEGPLKVIYAGRLVYWKGVHLALEAMAAAEAPHRGMTLTIAGDGPERSRLEQMARDLGLDGCVRFLGRVPEGSMIELLRMHNALVFPSFQDSGAFAVLEAMAQRLPVVALKCGGPAVLVSDDSGILVDAVSPHQTVADLSAALVRLNDDPELRLRLGAAGARRAVEAFSWDRIADVTEQLYDAIALPRSVPSIPALTTLNPKRESE